MNKNEIQAAIDAVQQADYSTDGRTIEIDIIHSKLILSALKAQRDDGNDPFILCPSEANEALDRIDETIGLMRGCLNDPPELVAMNVESMKADMDGMIKDLRKYGAVWRKPAPTSEETK